MNAVAASIAAAVVAAGLANALAYFVARRRYGGAVQTSEASSLWQESSNIRRDLYGELTALRTEVNVLRQRLTSTEGDLDRERTERVNCMHRLLALEMTVGKPPP